MHPAYGAGHATVAGGCVTMLKAFFEMFEHCDSGKERKLLDPTGNPICFVPDETGGELIPDPKGAARIMTRVELNFAYTSLYSERPRLRGTCMSTDRARLKAFCVACLPSTPPP